MVHFPRGKNTDSRKDFISSNLERTDISNSDVSQIRSSNESDIFLKTLDQQKELRMKSKS